MCLGAQNHRRRISQSLGGETADCLSLLQRWRLERERYPGLDSCPSAVWPCCDVRKSWRPPEVHRPVWFLSNWTSLISWQPSRPLDMAGRAFPAAQRRELLIGPTAFPRWPRRSSQPLGFTWESEEGALFLGNQAAANGAAFRCSDSLFSWTLLQVFFSRRRNKMSAR